MSHLRAVPSQTGIPVSEAEARVRHQAIIAELHKAAELHASKALLADLLEDQADIYLALFRACMDTAAEVRAGTL